MAENKNKKFGWTQLFSSVIIFITMCFAILGFFSLFEPAPKCYVYSVGGNATEYPCDLIEEFCDDIGCTRNYGSCGKPLCICVGEGG